ncbi:MAG: hypothetical protein JKY65_33580 [Planctomycetes bacterium]|nr:hypothetical protein [Planctomycetota bacterium]
MRPLCLALLLSLAGCGLGSSRPSAEVSEVSELTRKPYPLRPGHGPNILCVGCSRFTLCASRSQRADRSRPSQLVGPPLVATPTPDRPPETNLPDLEPIPDWDDAPPPPKSALTEGHVIALRPDLEPVWVLIDIGSSNGIKIGQVFGVFRSGTQLAQLVADQVTLYQTACRLTFAPQARRIRVGDRVSTRGAGEEFEEQRREEWPALVVPEIYAEVLATKDDMGPALVLLNVGSDDRVEPGYRFLIYRGSEFVGKVVVERVLRDSSGCRALFCAEGERIRPGDKAATRLQ